MRIGELAVRAGVPVKTIRYYEDIGVLAPPARTASGYRNYDDTVVDRLTFVRSAQSVGLTLGEIREIVALRDRGETPCGHVTELLQRRAAEIEERIASLQRLQGELRRLARRARLLDPADCDPGLVCHLITPAASRSQPEAQSASGPRPATPVSDEPAEASSRADKPERAAGTMR